MNADLVVEADPRKVDWPSAQPTRPARESGAIAVLVTAFATDPAARWMYPAAQQYLTHFPDFVRAFAGRALEHGSADAVGTFHCAALWLPPGVPPDEAAVVDVLQRSVHPDRLPEVFSVLEQLGAHRPTEPHWHLPLIGVDPTKQGRGFGSALLRRGLARCDRDRGPAYLEATSSRSAALYERFGFEAVAQIKTRTSPLIIPMIRAVP
ncbi:MAG: GNAT family N-acetyltransferase [Limisphaerales bacterium]